MLSKNKFYVIVLLSVLVFIQGCEINLNDHYDEQDNTIEKDKIISEMEKIPEISAFTEAVKNIDTLAFLLDQNRLYTVFAPVNETFQQIDPDILNNNTLFTRMVLYHFINGKYKYKDLSYDYLETFNKKYLFVSLNGSTVLLDSNKTIVQSDFLSQNGMIQVIDKPLTPTDNLYEYLLSSPYTNQFGKAIPDFSIKEFDKNASIPIDEDENGNLIYDSVFIVTNPFLIKDYDQNYYEFYETEIKYKNIESENRWFTFVFPVNYESELNEIKNSSFLNNSISDHHWAAPVLANMVWKWDYSREEIISEIIEYHEEGDGDSLKVQLYFADLLANNYIEFNYLSNSTVHFVDGFEYDMSWLIKDQCQADEYEKERDYRKNLISNTTFSENVDSVFSYLNNIKIIFNENPEEDYSTKYGEWINFELTGNFYPVDYKIMVRGKNYASGTYMVEADGKQIGEYNFSTAPTGDVDTDFDEVGVVSFTETKSITNLKFTFVNTHPENYKEEQYLWIREIKFSPIIK